MGRLRRLGGPRVLRTLSDVRQHGGPNYEMLFTGTPHETPMSLQLHCWDAHEHPYLGSPEGDHGNGVSLWFEVADQAALDATWKRAAESSAEVLEAPHHNPLAHHHEFAISMAM